MFHYYQPTKIHFGAGQLNELGHICRGYGKTCFLVTTPDAPLQPLYERVKKLLDAEGISVIHFDKVESKCGNRRTGICHAEGAACRFCIGSRGRKLD